MCAVSPETIRKWIRMKEKPTLEALLLLCRTLRLGFHELMDYQRLSSESYRSLYDSYGQNESLNFSQRPSMVDKDQQKEEELLKEIVEGKKEPCSRKELAHLCGCSIGRLESRYPVLVREVARLYKSKRAEHKRQRIELLEEAIRRAATKAKRRGMNLSWRNLFSLIPEDMHYKYTVQEISRARDKILRSTM